VKKHQLAALLWLVVSSISGQTLVDVRTQTKNVDFSGAASTIPAKSGTSLPASCKLGEMFFNTSNSPGQNLYTCAPANTWSLLSGGGGSGGGSGISVPALTTVGNLPQYANTSGTALAAGLSVVTTVGNPGSATSVPTESAVRSAISATGSTFSNLTGGTNTGAAMLIGSGASLAASGSGTIAATSVPASGVTGLAPSATTDTTNAGNISTGTLPAGRLPNPSATTLGGVQSATAAAHQWVNSISTSGVPALSQPTASDIGGLAPSATTDTTNAGNITTGTLPAGRLPNPSATTLGGVQSATAAAHHWVNSISTSGVPALSQPTASDISGLAPSATTDTTNAGNISTGTLPAGRLPNPSTTTLGGVQSATAAAHQWVNSISTSGVPALSQPTFADMASGTNTSGAMVVGAGSSLSTANGGNIAATTSQVLQAAQHIAEGDSITAGYLVTPTTMYASLLSTDENNTLTDRAVSGQQACDLSVTQTVKYDLTTFDKNPAIYTMMIGTNDANVKGTGAYEPIYQGCHKAAIAWIAAPNKVAANSTNCVDTGTWAISTGFVLSGEYSTTNGSTKSCTVKTFGGPLYAWYLQQDGNGGTFTYSVDGGTPVALATATSPAIATQNGGVYGFNLLRVTGLAAGTHTIVFTVTSATNSSNGVSITAIGTTPPAGTYGFPRVFVGGVPRQQGDANSAVTAQYNADALADANLLAGDGLGVYFVNIRNYLCTNVSAGVCYNAAGVADMQTPGTPNDGGLHPNAVGHNDLKQAWEQAEQFVPNSSGTVNSGAAGQFATYSSAGAAVSGHTLVASDIPALSYDASGAAAAVQAASLQKSNNLSDLTSAATARTNLGFTFTGSGAQTVSGTAAGTSGNCAKWDANGNVVDAGAPCGTGSGGGGSSAWSSLTPGTNTSGAFVVGSGASLATSGTGTIAATSVPATGVSGTLAAANLPNPTASALGGVQSIASTPHQWMNSISTAGVPALSQPAFSDVSGTVADSQLPSDQCTLTKYAISYTALQAAASATPTSTVAVLPSTSARICLLEISGSSGFTGSGITAATVRLQSGAATPLLYSPNQDIGTAVNTTPNNDFWSDSGNMADRTNLNIVAAFTFTGGLSSALTAGNVYITIGIRTMP